MTRYLASFLLLASAPMFSACFQPESVTCGEEGPICPSGWVCIAELSACINPVTTLCGNGAIDEGEACDDGNLSNHDECNWDCQLPRCGDGFLDSPEVCDDGNTRNGDGCSADCASEEVCGDGYLNDYNHGDNLPPEECDEGGVNTANCNADCTSSICGDGKVNAASGEICDGGNSVTRTPTDTDECDRDCTPNECGDTYINAVALEQCDNGRYCANGEQCETAADCNGIGDGLCTTRDFDCCTRTCKNPQCGNGVFEPTCEGFPLEVCDDGSHCSDLRPCTLDSQCAGIGDGLCRPRNGTGCSGDCRFPETCGDGEVQDYAPYFEVCDDGTHCSDGLTACTSESDCAGFEDTSCAPRNGTGCASNCKSLEECGDGILNAYPRRQGDGSVLPAEVCDDGKQCANGRACQDSSECADVAGDQVCRTRNADGCSNDCLSEEVCGDGIHNNYPHPTVNLRPIVGVPTVLVPIVRAEACDNGRHCANGTDCVVDEDCALVPGDDKACVPRDGDGCSADCLSAESCGDGYFNDYAHVDGEGGSLPAEICDDGNNLPDDGCSASCSSTEQCGNGIQDPGEECDEGADINGTEFSVLNCTRNCTISACGNSRRDPGEQCDRPDNLGGNVIDGPCNLECVCNVCGDNVVNTVGSFELHCGASTALEECDTGGINSATCNFDCTNPACGDGIVNFQAGESCDEGPPDDPEATGSKQTTACNSDCSIAFCGDGKLNIARGEVCDDGNNTNGDGCSADCRSEEFCGDGTVNSYPHIDDEGDPLPAEICDDGRHCSNGDSCTSDADCADIVGDCQVRGGTGCSPDCLSFEVCGDAYLSNYAPVNETCDDGNDASGDGCDGDACTVETGWSCPTLGMPCFEVCGDGLIVGDETCDDNDQEGGDGCSATCQTELGYSCPDDNGTGGACSPICGDFLIRGAETCDDGDQTAGDGCGATCLEESGWDCPGVVGGVGGVCTPVCGDGVVAGTEECDDGGRCGNSSVACSSDADCNAAGENGTCNPVGDDGCSDICRVELGWVCPETGGEPVGGACVTDCGDFLIRGDEECDDGNTASSDGCDGTCQFEEGWTCPAGFEVVGGECQEICGDGLVRGSESCDDSNTTTGDGCDSACQAETGWDCPLNAGVGGSCSPDCGDGLIRGSETCDEGTDGPSGGCTACVAQDGWRCPTAGGTGGLCSTICGDGKIRGAETCDDTNLVSNDGCSALCAEESGWDCPGTVGGNGGGCATVCGDGLIRGTETCDEGGSPSAGGCTSCVAQSGWSCPTAGGTGGTCETVCGDRLVRGAETCDDGDESAGDGCGSTCLIESGWACPTAGGVGGECATVCGDGIVAGAEQCDDSGTASGDGCDSGCRAETPVVGDDTYRALDGEAPYVIDVTTLTANDSAWAAPTFEADLETSCGGSLDYDDVALTLTYVPSGSPTCGSPWNDGFSYSLCNPAFPSLCTDGDVAIALNRLPTLADANACMPVGSVNTSVNVSSLFTDPDNHSVDVTSIDAGPATGGTASVAGTLVTWTPTNPSAAASFSVPFEACDTGVPSACDSATWSLLWNDNPVLDTDYGTTPTTAPKGQTVEILFKDLIVSPGSQPVVDGGDTEKTWIATVIGSVTVSATENGTYASSAATTEGTCSVLSDKITFSTPSNADDASDGCWVQVCETCSGGPVCTKQFLAFSVVACSDTESGTTTDLGCTSEAPLCHTLHPSGEPTCVSCLLNTHCTSSNPVCNLSTFTCTKCTNSAAAGLVDSGCADPEPTCRTTGGQNTCVECTANADCGRRGDSYDTCDTSENICGECATNSDCNGGAGFCVTRDVDGTDRKVCVDCTQDSECGVDEVCDPASDTCVGCVDDTDCDGATPICNTTSQVCVECDGNEDCTGGESCDTDSGVCVGCLSSTDCIGNDSGFVCGVGGSCGCSVAATDCPTDYTCESNVCVAPPVVATADTVGFALDPGTTEYALSVFLDNDDFADSASFNLGGNADGATACGGSVALGTGTVILTPPADPIACDPDYQDSFVYEVCSEFDAEDCQSATVTVLYNRSPTVTDTTTCVNVNTADLLLDASTLYTDPETDAIGTVTVTTQPSGGNVVVANTDELTLTPTDASAAATFSTIFEVCDTRTADFWDAACDTATWTALWNDAPTLADLATTPTPAAFSTTTVVDLATLVTSWGTVQGDDTTPLASLEVSDTENGTYGSSASPTGGGTCTVVGETLEYAAPASGTTASCWVEVCEACGSTPSCVKTELVFTLQECVATDADPDPGCGSSAPICDTNGAPICVVCIDDGDGVTDTGCDGATPACDDVADACVECTAAADCEAGEVCTANACEPE